MQPFSWHSEEGGEQKVNISQEEQSQPKNYKYKNNNNLGTITIITIYNNNNNNIGAKSEHLSRGAEPTPKTKNMSTITIMI